MSVASEINRIKNNIAEAYAAVEEKGGSIPDVQNSTNLADAIQSISSGGGGSVPLDPVEVYQNTRPADWLLMPEPQDNEMYLLFHIPDGVSSLLAFTVTCTGSYTVATGTVENGVFVQSGSVSVASGAKYETELFANDFGSLTSTGMKQCMVKVSGTNILTWEPSAHSKKSSPSNFCAWNIVEISCKLPSGTKVACGNTSSTKSLRQLKYFRWFGNNNVTTTISMFNACYSLTAIPQLDTANVTNMSSMFSYCNSLAAIPQLNTANVTNMSSMFNACNSLTAIPQLDTANVTNMISMFSYCYSLTAIPQLDTANVTNMIDVFNSCNSLTAIPQLNTANVTNMSNVFYNCNSLAKLTLTPSVAGWGGYAISLSNCSLGHQSLVDFFNSLPTITSSKALTLTGNPGVSELTDAEKAIATGKNWTLTL